MMNSTVNHAMLATASDILAQLAASAITTTDKGKKLELLSSEYFKISPIYSGKFSEVWLWNDWPGRGSSPDVGIDIVAKLRDEEGYCAIQCKFYDSNYVIQKQDIDSFFTASGKKIFKNRIIVCTSDKWSKHAEDALKDQTIPIVRIRPQDWDDIDWNNFDLGKPSKLERKQRKTLLPHQEDAVSDVLHGFSGSDRGKLIMACGTGKTFTSLKIMEKLVGENGIALFLVPSIALLSQTIKEWSSEAERAFRCYAVCSDDTVGKFKDKEDSNSYDLAIPACTSANTLMKSFDNYHEQGLTIIFSTYHSIKVISEAQKNGLPSIDIVICDEAHRTTGIINKNLNDDDSAFVQVHSQELVNAKKRLYMTATPRIYAENTKNVINKKDDVILCSMDDQEIYGDVFHYLGFSEAVDKGLLADYKVLILAVDEKFVSSWMQNIVSSAERELTFLDDAVKILGCYDGLSRNSSTGDVCNHMRKAVAFSSSIANSKRITNMFRSVVSEKVKNIDSSDTKLVCEIDHVDGTFNSLARNEKIAWLKEDTEDGICRILSNVRCLSEGVDVPALDAAIFFNPRNSIIDIVQSVGRVMRRAEGKKYGYILLPVGVPNQGSIDNVLSDNKYAVVWRVLQALRAHDDSLRSVIGDFSLKKIKDDRIRIIGVGSRNDDFTDGHNDDAAICFDDLKTAIYAKIVDKCGERLYNEDERREFFELLRQSMIQNNVYSVPQKPNTGAYTLDLVKWGVQGVFLTNKIDSCGNYLEHMVFLKHRQCYPSPAIFLNELCRYSNEIEQKLNVGSLDWSNKFESKNKIISLKYAFDFRARENWPEGIQWLTDMMIKFEEVFRPYVHKVKDKMRKENVHIKIDKN